jgi:hypothetical protein
MLSLGKGGRYRIGLECLKSLNQATLDKDVPPFTQPFQADLPQAGGEVEIKCIYL